MVQFLKKPRTVLNNPTMTMVYGAWENTKDRELSHGFNGRQRARE
jgi:hypothetical protein